MEAPDGSQAAWADALVATFDAQRRTMLAIATQIVGANDALDVVQDVLLSLWHRPTTFDPARGTLGSFLRMMTRSAAIDRLRANIRRRERESRHHQDRQRLPFDVETIDRGLPGAIDRLRSDQRALVVDAFYEHLTYREIAVHRQVPEGTVKSRIRRAIADLRRDLDDADPVRAAAPAAIGRFGPRSSRSVSVTGVASPAS